MLGVLVSVSSSRVVLKRGTVPSLNPPYEFLPTKPTKPEGITDLRQVCAVPSCRQTVKDGMSLRYFARGAAKQAVYVGSRKLCLIPHQESVHSISKILIMLLASSWAMSCKY